MPPGMSVADDAPSVPPLAEDEGDGDGVGVLVDLDGEGLGLGTGTLPAEMQTTENVTDEPGVATDGAMPICGPAAKAGATVPAKVAAPASVKAAPAERIIRMKILPPSMRPSHAVPLLRAVPRDYGTSASDYYPL